MRDHSPIKIVNFNGLFDCGEDVSVPHNYFKDCLNLEFLKRGFRTRSGSRQSLDIDNIRRIQIFRIAGQAQRLLILNNSGSLYDSTNLNVPILIINGMTDFSSVTMFNRAYITPHNGETGLPGQAVYVYNGAGVARKAAGEAPSGLSLVAADDTNSGKVEYGIHLLGVCYETNSGFLTRPGGIIAFESVGGRRLKISNIPQGPTGISARVLVATKILRVFNGDIVNQSYFFIPNGRIANNIDVSIVVDFYDADLQANATYLSEQLEEIPAGVCINSTARSRMLVGGENLHASTVRVSAAGEPESFNAVEGFFNVNPGDAGSGVKNLFEHREVIVISKSQRTYAVVDNLSPAAFWKVLGLDPSVGAEPHSVARILDYGQTIQDLAIIADRSGIHIFNGTFSLPPLTFNIDDYWKRINSDHFDKVELILDPVSYKIYAIVPLDDAVLPSHVLVGDFRLGLSHETIKWAPWTFPNPPQTGVVDVKLSSSIPYFRFGSSDGNVYDIDPAIREDYGTAITTIAEFTPLPHEVANWREGIYHFGGMRLRARGFGFVYVTAVGLDDAQSESFGVVSLATIPGKEAFKLLNFKNERCSIRLTMTSHGDWMLVTKMSLFAKFLWSEQPT